MSKNVVLTDSSQNIVDPSYHLLTYNKNYGNRIKTPFHQCKKENNVNDNINDNVNDIPIKNNINSKKFIFSMKLDNVLNDLKATRDDNYRKISYINVVNYLDTRPLLLKDTKKKPDWVDWVHKTNKKYNDITLGNFTKSPNYALMPYQTRNRRRSVYRAILPLPARLPPPPPLPVIEKVDIDVEINSLKDILQLCNDYPIKSNVEYNINMKAIHHIKEPLTELDNMIGLSPLKLSIMDQILYFIQDLHKTDNIKNNDFMHTVIYGPPGTGKTEVAKIMGKIFSKMGILPRNIFKKATRADLIAGYLGQTALKPKDLVKECLGGVLFY